MSQKDPKEAMTDIAFKLFDVDRDGFITKDEFTQVGKQLMKLLKKIFLDLFKVLPIVYN